MRCRCVGNSVPLDATLLFWIVFGRLEEGNQNGPTEEMGDFKTRHVKEYMSRMRSFPDSAKSMLSQLN